MHTYLQCVIQSAPMAAFASPTTCASVLWGKVAVFACMLMAYASCLERFISGNVGGMEGFGKTTNHQHQWFCRIFQIFQPYSSYVFVDIWFLCSCVNVFVPVYVIIMLYGGLDVVVADPSTIHLPMPPFQSLTLTHSLTHSHT